MLFLAITLGFLVENLREDYKEHQRELRYIHSLIWDIRKDSMRLSDYISFKDTKKKLMDSLLNFLLSGSYKQSGSDTYYMGRWVTSDRNTFYNSDGTMQQLKNAGGLRLIQKQNIVDSIMEYDEKVKILLRQISEDQGYEAAFGQIAGEIFDVNVFYRQGLDFNSINVRPEGNPQLLTNDKEKINKVAMQVRFVAGIQRTNRVWAEILTAKGIRLIEFLEKEYHLK